MTEPQATPGGRALDSPSKNRFDEEDEKLLQKIADESAPTVLHRPVLKVDTRHLPVARR
jgi:hypothetical protein